MANSLTSHDLKLYFNNRIVARVNIKYKITFLHSLHCQSCRTNERWIFEMRSISISSMRLGANTFLQPEQKNFDCFDGSISKIQKQFLFIFWWFWPVSNAASDKGFKWRSVICEHFLQNMCSIMMFRKDWFGWSGTNGQAELVWRMRNNWFLSWSTSSTIYWLTDRILTVN